MAHAPGQQWVSNMQPIVSSDGDALEGLVREST